MRMRSTGLGKTELEADVASLELKEGMLLLNIQTTKPVIWHIRAGIQRKDIFKMMKEVLSFRVIKHVLGMMIRGNHPGPAEF